MITFGIITNGKRLPKLLREIDSIRALNIPEYEIIVSGKPPEIEGITRFELPEAADAGRLGEMRNAIAEWAHGELVSITDDDILFQPDWYEGLQSYQGEWDVMCSRLLNPDGTRNWDWCTKGGPRGHILIEYWETDPWIYVTGGRILARREVFDLCQWDATLGFNQEEDVKFSRALQLANQKIVMNKKMTLLHDDPTLTSKGHLIYRVS